MYVLYLSRLWATADPRLQVIPDEESRLIPVTEDETKSVAIHSQAELHSLFSSSLIPNSVAIDHQRLKDRLGTIVRSKEG